MEDYLPNNSTLTGLHWPSAIETMEGTLKVASVALSVCYILGSTIVAVAVLLAFLNLFLGLRLVSWVILACDLVSCLSHPMSNHTADEQFALLAITSATVLSTLVIEKGVEALNHYGKEIGVTATKGTTFLGMTRAATVLILVATLVFLL